MSERRCVRARRRGRAQDRCEHHHAGDHRERGGIGDAARDPSGDGRGGPPTEAVRQAAVLTALDLARDNVFD
jgi:hypothetical protein